MSVCRGKPKCPHLAMSMLLAQNMSVSWRLHNREILPRATRPIDHTQRENQGTGISTYFTS